MKFALRYWWKEVWGAIKAIWGFLAAFGGLTLISSIGLAKAGSSEDSVFYIIGRALAPPLIWIVLMMLFGLIIVAERYDVYKIRNEKGFCLDYFYAFKDKYIQGKPVVVGNYIEFAEIYQQMGDYKSAFAILNSLNIPEADYINRSRYIFVYLNTAIGTGDSALADDVWRQNQRFMRSWGVRFMQKNLFVGIDLLTAKIDCLAGRYSLALEMCEKMLQKGKGCEEDFSVLRVYIYKKLGLEAQYTLALAEAQLALAKSDPVFDSTRAEQQRDLLKAMNGELPV